MEVLPRTITDESQDQQQIDIVDAMIVDQVDAILIAPANSKSARPALPVPRRRGYLSST